MKIHIRAARRNSDNKDRDLSSCKYLELFNQLICSYKRGSIARVQSLHTT